MNPTTMARSLRGNRTGVPLHCPHIPDGHSTRSTEVAYYSTNISSHTQRVNDTCFDSEGKGGGNKWSAGEENMA